MIRNRLLTCLQSMASSSRHASSRNKGARLRPSVAHPQLLSLQPVERQEGEPTTAVYDQTISSLSADDPLLHDDYFNVHELITEADLMKHKVYWGHKLGTLHAAQQEYLLGHRLGTCVVDLRFTVRQLQSALNFLAHVAYHDGIILFASYDRANMLEIERTALDCGQFAHTRLWKDGIFTDSRKKFYGDVRLPDCVVMTGCSYPQQRQHPVIIEAAKMCIPVVAVCDTNIDSRLVTYPIAGNDDSRDTVGYWLRLYKEAINRGRFDVHTPRLPEVSKVVDTIAEGEEEVQAILQSSSVFDDVAVVQDEKVSSAFVPEVKTEPKLAEPLVVPTPPQSAEMSDKRSKFRQIIEQLNREAEAAEKIDNGDK